LTENQDGDQDGEEGRDRLYSFNKMEHKEVQ